MQFSQAQRELAIRAVDEAEERTARYYCIPPFRWEQYDLLTRQDHEWEPVPDDVLAQVKYLQRLTQKLGGLHAFYRIQLNDPAILAVASRENLGSHFYPFLVYILTHEMIHLVRLSSILEAPAELTPFDESEEQRVRRISQQILTGSREFHPILERFGVPAPSKHWASSNL